MIVHADRFEDLRLDKVADAHLGHDRDADRGHDLLDQAGVRHAGHTAGDANVGRDAFQGHDGDRAGLFRDDRVLRGDHIHDHAALKHLGQAALDGYIADFTSAVGMSILVHYYLRNMI